MIVAGIRLSGGILVKTSDELSSCEVAAAAVVNNLNLRENWFDLEKSTAAILWEDFKVIWERWSVVLLHEIGKNGARWLPWIVVCSLSNLLKVVAPISIEIAAMADELVSRGALGGFGVYLRFLASLRFCVCVPLIHYHTGYVVCTIRKMGFYILFWTW